MIMRPTRPQLGPQVKEEDANVSEQRTSWLGSSRRSLSDVITDTDTNVSGSWRHARLGSTVTLPGLHLVISFAWEEF